MTGCIGTCAKLAVMSDRANGDSNKLLYIINDSSVITHSNTSSELSDVDISTHPDF